MEIIWLLPWGWIETAPRTNTDGIYFRYEGNIDNSET